MKITLVGSIAFQDKFVEIYNELRKLGHDPVIHEHMFEYSKTSWEEFHTRDQIEHAKTKIENDYIKWWHQRINESDAILVLNFDKKGIKNYIGGNTLMEIAFAHVGDKDIYLMNPIPKDVPYNEELRAMIKDDYILNGDTTKII